MQSLDLTQKIHLHQVNLDTLENLFRWLSPAEQARANKMSIPKYQQRFINGRGYLRYCLTQYLEEDLLNLEFSLGEKGKLYLPDSNLFFNLAHTDCMALYAFNLDHEIGIDIERQRYMRDIEAIAKRVFTPTELDYLQNAPAQEQAFFSLWTRKEAVIKASGQGITSNLQDITTTLNNGDIASSIPHIEGLDLSLIDLEIEMPYRAALVAKLEGKVIEWLPNLVLAKMTE